jgi:hypothetical protein
MRIETNLASRIALNHRSPNFESLLGFIDLETGVASFEKLFRGPVFDNRSPDRSILSRSEGSKKNEDRE